MTNEGWSVGVKVISHSHIQPHAPPLFFIFFFFLGCTSPSLFFCNVYFSHYEFILQ